MKAPICALSLALLAASSAFAADVAAAASDSASLPPIFVPRAERGVPVQATALVPATPAASPISARMRGILTEKITAAAHAIEAVPVTGATSTTTPYDGSALGAVMMDELRVKSTPLPVVESPRLETSLWQILETGILHQHTNRAGRKSVLFFNVLSIEPRTITPRDSTRITIGYSINW